MPVKNVPTMADLARVSASQHQPSQERGGFSPKNLATLRAKLVMYAEEIGLDLSLLDRHVCVQRFEEVILKHHPKNGPKAYKPNTYLDYSTRYVVYHDLFFSVYPLAKEPHLRTFITARELQDTMEAGGTTAFGALEKFQHCTPKNLHTNYGRYLKAIQLFRAFLVDTLGADTDDVPLKITVAASDRRNSNFHKWLMDEHGLGAAVADKKVARVNFLLEKVPVWHKTPESLLADAPQAELFPPQKADKISPRSPADACVAALRGSSQDPVAQTPVVVIQGSPEAPVVFEAPAVIEVPVVVGAPQKSSPPTLGIVAMRALLKFADKKSLLQSFGEAEPFVAIATTHNGGTIRVSRDEAQTLSITMDAQAVEALPLGGAAEKSKPRKKKSMTMPGLSSRPN